MAIRLLFCVLIALLSSTHSADDPSDLKQVNLVFRHGDRSPIDIFPTDVNNITMWPQGLGWLSTMGMMQHYKLGQYLRQRYTGFLNDTYKHTEIVIESSDEDRCLMSAYCNLAGLYPPAGYQKWNPNLDWQPIPVHTRPRVEDNYLNMGENCPRYQALMEETLRSFNVTEEERRNKGFYKFIADKTGWPNQNISTIWRVADTLICEEQHGIQNNTWANDTVMDKLKMLESYQFTLMYDSPEKARLKGGPLLKDFIANMQSSLDGTDTLKMHMYSGHDTTVAALLSALGVYNGLSPPYAAAVLVELHSPANSAPYINILYKNDTDLDQVVPLTLPGCVPDCPFDQFVSLTKNAIPVNWDLECGNRADQDTSGKQLSTAWIIVIALSVLLLFNLVVYLACFIRGRRAKASNSSAYGRFDVST